MQSKCSFHAAEILNFFVFFGHLLAINYFSFALIAVSFQLVSLQLSSSLLCTLSSGIELFLVIIFVLRALCC